MHAGLQPAAIGDQLNSVHGRPLFPAEHKTRLTQVVHSYTGGSPWTATYLHNDGRILFDVLKTASGTSRTEQEQRGTLHMFFGSRASRPGSELIFRHQAEDASTPTTGGEGEGH